MILPPVFLFIFHDNRQYRYGNTQVLRKSNPLFEDFSLLVLYYVSYYIVKIKIG